MLDGAALGMGGGDDGAGMMQAAAEQPPPVDLRGENPLMAFVRTMLPWVNVGEMTDEQLEGLAQQVRESTLTLAELHGTRLDGVSIAHGLSAS